MRSVTQGQFSHIPRAVVLHGVRPPTARVRTHKGFEIRLRRQSNEIGGIGLPRVKLCVLGEEVGFEVVVA